MEEMPISLTDSKIEMKYTNLDLRERWDLLTNLIWIQNYLSTQEYVEGNYTSKLAYFLRWIHPKTGICSIHRLTVAFLSLRLLLISVILYLLLVFLNLISLIYLRGIILSQSTTSFLFNLLFSVFLPNYLQIHKELFQVPVFYIFDILDVQLERRNNLIWLVTSSRLFDVWEVVMLDKLKIYIDSLIFH